MAARKTESRKYKKTLLAGPQANYLRRMARSFTKPLPTAIRQATVQAPGPRLRRGRGVTPRLSIGWTICYADSGALPVVPDACALAHF